MYIFIHSFSALPRTFRLASARLPRIHFRDVNDKICWIRLSKGPSNIALRIINIHIDVYNNVYIYVYI